MNVTPARSSDTSTTVDTESDGSLTPADHEFAITQNEYVVPSTRPVITHESSPRLTHSNPFCAE